MVFDEFQDATGSYHYTLSESYQGVSGTGLSTGASYRGVGASEREAEGYETSFASNTWKVCSGW